MIDATAIIMTKNEEKNIVDCLKSMEGFAKRCVVIDCGSVDKTTQLAKEYGADVYFHDFEYYAKQFNWGIDNCDIQTEWIIRLDADERFPDSLKTEIEDIISKNQDGANGIIIEADFYFLGKCMKHGLKNKRKMMLFRHGIGRIEDRRRDPHSILSSGYSVSCKKRFVHYDFKDLDNYIKKYNWYAIREMQDYIDYSRGEKAKVVNDKHIMKQRKKKFGFYYKMPSLLRAHWWFLYIYIIKGGFLDGKEGFIYYFLECYWYRLLVDAKIYEYEINGEKEFEILKSMD